ncbi:unnamed protein product [Dimorphilus gyrociliatus]|uniref:Uncharacterized protein n=1 Tax=Dimorphilus gyrociliatus TaxID=2664684 RepID=A0A7I8VQ09_9ANNE|nr:unnamed protein product [Dimorphilus gyrociliatus]
MAKIKVIREYPKYKATLERIIWQSGLKVCSTYAHSMNLCFGNNKQYNLQFYDKCSQIVASLSRGNDSISFHQEKSNIESYGAQRVSYMLIKLPENYFIPSVPNTLRHLCILFNPNESLFQQSKKTNKDKENPEKRVKNRPEGNEKGIQN